MKIYNSIDGYAALGLRSRVALGYFDGVHLGHRAVISACAGGGEAVPVVLTFSESPAKALGRPAPPELTDNEAKAELMESAGAEAVIFADFLSVKDISAGDFVTAVLKDKLKAELVTCGYNYRFGKNGSGDTAELARLCAGAGIECRTVAPVTAGGETVSSTAIRELLARGEVEKANEMLGYGYRIRGEIRGGNHIGTALGFPTVNVELRDGLCVPRYGVYATRITVDGRTYRGATNIGVHPTVGETPRPLCETFIIGYTGGDIYGEKAEAELVRFVRPEMRFASAEELRAQIERDLREVGEE